MRRRMPSRQHEDAKRTLFEHLQRKLSDAPEAVAQMGESHPPFHDSSTVSPSDQLVDWTCERLHEHVLHILTGASSVAIERRHSMSDGSPCIPDITVLNEAGRPSRSYAPDPDHAVAIAGEMDIPLFVVLAPMVSMVRPPLQPEPHGVQTDEDEHGRQVPRRFSGSAPSFGNDYPLVASAILAERCTWSCERASEVFEAWNPGSEPAQPT